MGRILQTENSLKDNHGVDQAFAVSPYPTDRTVFLSGDVNEHSISNVIAQLVGLANINRSPIYLIVSTYGGSVDEMFSLYDTMKFLPCPVYTIALGKVMSAGVLLLSAGVKGKRMIGRNARIMIHPVSGGTFGNVFETVNSAEEMKRLHDQLVKALSLETSMTEKNIEVIMKKGFDYFIDAEEAIKLGIVDKLI